MSIKAYVIAAVVLLLLVSEGLLCWRFYADGEAKAQRADAARAAKDEVAAQARVKAQADADAKISGDTISALNTQLAALRAAAPPVRVVRLCIPPAGRDPMPTSSSPAAGATASAAGPASVRSLPGGVGSGPDIGAGLSDLAYAAGVVSAYQRALATWAVSQSN